MSRWVGVMALLAAAPAMAEPTSGAPPRAAPVEYAVTLAPLSGVQTTGWSLYATIHGRSMDLQQSSLGWAEDGRAPRGDIEAGYGWRGGGATALFGYIQHDIAAPDFGPRPPADTPNSRRVGGSSGLIGMGVVLNAH